MAGLEEKIFFREEQRGVNAIMVILTVTRFVIDKGKDYGELEFSD